jgi:hypothetical protein
MSAWKEFRHEREKKLFEDYNRLAGGAPEALGVLIYGAGEKSRSPALDFLRLRYDLAGI